MAGTLLLTAIAVLQWAEHHQRPVAAVAVDGIREVQEAGPRGRIVLTPWDHIDSFAPYRLSILTPPAHPDARPWPQGMVIGMGAPSVDPEILMWTGSPLANVMSVFLAPWRALTGQLGA